MYKLLFIVFIIKLYARINIFKENLHPLLYISTPEENIKVINLVDGLKNKPYFQ